MADMDYKKNLVEYFKRNLGKGYPHETLKWALINQGYSRTDVTRAYEDAAKELAEKAPKLKEEKPKIVHEYYDSKNKPIKVTTKKPLSWKKILKKFGLDDLLN